MRKKIYVEEKSEEDEDEDEDRISSIPKALPIRTNGHGLENVLGKQYFNNMLAEVQQFTSRTIAVRSVQLSVHT